MLINKYYKYEINTNHYKKCVDKINYNLFENKKLKIKNYNIKNETIISYIITINVSNRNIICNIVSNSGKIIFNVTSGKIGIKGRLKSKKFALISILKKLFYGCKFLKNKKTLVKLKGFKYNNKLIIKKLKEFLVIATITYESVVPHNGCRPKKFKRK